MSDRPAFQHLEHPTSGERIEWEGDTINVPDNPIIPFIEGDGIGVDIWAASKRVFDAAVEKAYGGSRKIEWFEIFAGDKAHDRFDEWLPEDTPKAIGYYYVAIKGPLTTPVGGGIRSLNVTLRQILDLYACVRPVYYIPGVPSPVKHPERMDMIIFRENTEDVYSGVEWQEGTPEAEKVIDFLNGEMGRDIRTDSGIGIKPISITGTRRLVRKAIKYALEKALPSVTTVHKGNIMKFTEGAFRDWGYDVAREEFRDQCITERESWILGNKDRNPDITIAENAAMIEPGYDRLPPEHQAGIRAEVEGVLDAIWESHGNGKWKEKLLIKDRIADAMLQQVLTRTSEYSVLALPNLNGDYMSDALAAQIGGLGVAPGANIGDRVALFEATHGTAPKYAGLDKVNPSSVILSGRMMFEYMGWNEAGDLILKGIRRSIEQKRVTYDLERQMEGATKLKCSEFGDAIIENMD